MNDENKSKGNNYCPTCEWFEKERDKDIPTVRGQLDVMNNTGDKIRYRCVDWLGEEYRIGSSVFLQPDTFKFKDFNPEKEVLKTRTDVRKILKFGEKFLLMALETLVCQAAATHTFMASYGQILDFQGLLWSHFRFSGPLMVRF